MKINLKYFLTPLFALSLTLTQASESSVESAPDDGDTTASRPQVHCGHDTCQAKLDKKLKGKTANSRPSDEPDDEVESLVLVGAMLKALLKAQGDRKDYSDVLSEHAPKSTSEFNLGNPNISIDGTKLTLKKFALENVTTEAKRHVLTLTNGIRLALYDAKMDALQFFVAGELGEALSSTYFSNEVVRFGNVTFSPKDGFDNIKALLLKAKLMPPQDSAEEKVAIIYVKRLSLEYELDMLERFSKEDTTIKSSVAGSSNVNIIDPSFTPAVAAEPVVSTGAEVDAGTSAE